MKKKLCCILILIILLLNSSIMILVSEAVDVIQNEIESNSEDKVKVLSEINLTKYENFDTTEEKSKEGSKGVLVQFNLKTGIEFAEGEEYQPLKKTNTNIDLPWIGDYKPSRVEVIIKSTQATNGGKDATYEYHSSTGILQIIAENNDYTDNVENSRDEYEIICIYRKECYTDNKEEKSLKIRANVVETLSNQEENKVSTKIEQNYTVSDNIGTIISTESQTDDIYDGYITANALNPENQYETKYNEKLNITISNKDLAPIINVKKVSEIALYEETSIDKNLVLDMLGESGSIEILDENENVLATINKNTETDENGKIKVTYENRTQKIYIRLKNISKEGIIEVNNSRVILPTAQIVDNIVTTQGFINAITSDEIIKYEKSEQNKTQIKKAMSNIETTMNTETLVNNTANDVILTSVLKTNNPQYSLFKNPTINIEMPKEIESVKINSAELIYDNQNLKITSSKVSTNAKGNKVIIIQMQGIQTSYENSELIEGTAIRIPLTLTVAKNIENSEENIKISYSNEITETIENKDLKVTLLNKVANVMPTIINSVNNSSEVTSSTKTLNATTYENDGVTTEFIEEVGNTTVTNNGILYEKQIVKQTVKATNNSNIAKKVKFTINVPNEMVYVKLKTGGYIKNEEKGYYTYLDQYEYEEQEDKQVTIELTLNAGETKTDFIELKVKDLQDDVQEKQTTINCGVIIGNDSEVKLNTQNTIKKAEVSVDLKCLVGASNSRREWDYLLEVKNLTNKEISNFKIAFEASSFFNIQQVQLDEDTIQQNLEGNTWTYTVDKLEPFTDNTSGELSIYISGQVGEIEESQSAGYEINGLATIYGDNISTYASNKTRMTGCVEAVDVNMSSDKEELNMNDEITYTVNIKNIGKTWGAFGTYTRVNVTDIIPRELAPISVEYNEFEVIEETIADEEYPEWEHKVESFTEKQVTKDISTLEIPDGYDSEDAPNVDLVLAIPENKTVTLKIKAKAKMASSTKKITNSVTVKGDYITTKTAKVTSTVLKYDDSKKNPVNPIDPVNPVDPTNPDNNNNNSNSNNSNNANQKISISGIAWLDTNEDGKRTTDEKTYNNMTVMLYDYKNNTFVKENDQIRKVQTDSNGKYKFDNLPTGQYIVIFLYNTNEYTLTEYQKAGVIESKNSDAISKNVDIEGNTVLAGVTDTLTANSSLENIDIGLIENKNFDLGIQKYINKITIQTNDGKTKTYDYDNKQFAKVEVRSKKLEGATAIIEYKMVVTNNGELNGKAVQLVDKLPDGLKFKSELNKEWYEKDGNLYTNVLANQNIEVGQSQEVTLVLTKNINSSNVGTIVNNASIGISSNERAIEDGNNQNDNSSAQVIIAVATGIAQEITITLITMAVLISMAILLIIKNKKAVKITLFIAIFAICMVGNTQQVLGASFGHPDQNIQIRGVFDPEHRTHMLYSLGSDNNQYVCHSKGLAFCRAWHNATLISTDYKETPKTNWEDVQNTLTLTDNTDKTKVKFYKIDDDFNKIGPFNVSSDISNVKYTVSVEYKNENGEINTESFELIDFAWGQDFYIKVPKTVTQVQKISFSASNNITQSREVIKDYTYIYKITGHTDPNKNYCRKYSNGETKPIQDMYRIEEQTEKETRTISREATLEITGPWVGAGNVEIDKVDSDNQDIHLKNVEFVLLKGTDENSYMTVYKDNNKVDRIIVDDITLGDGEGSGIYSADTNEMSAIINGEKGYTIKFSSGFNDATILVTNSNGKIVINNLPLGEYTFKEKNNWNYGYTKKVDISTGQIKFMDTTSLTLGNEKQTTTTEEEKVDDRNEDKKLAGVEFVLTSTYKEGYLKVKVTDDSVLKDENGWAKKVVGTCTIQDTEDKETNPVIEYTGDINDATRFVTDENGKIRINNLVMNSDGEDSIKYKFIEVANPNYGYLANTDNNQNHKVSYEGDSVTSDGWITLTKKETTNTKIKNHQEYIRIEGFVWEDNPNGKNNTTDDIYSNDSDLLVEGINVNLCKDGQVVATRKTDANGWYSFGSKKADGEAYTDEDYSNPANGNLLIDDLYKYYVEFEYDGLRFTSVKAITDYLNANYDNTSKASETTSGRADGKDRNTVNADFSEITNNQSRNNGEKKYDLDYDYDKESHISTYVDHWGYQYDNEEKKTRLKVIPSNDYAIIASTKVSGFNLKDAWQARCASNGTDTLTGINLGIKRRAQADLAIMNDIQEVNIDVDNYENTYTYAKRSDYENENVNDPGYNSAKDGFGIDVKFGGKTQSIYSSRGLNLYTRRIYDADLALADKKSPDEILKIYVTYKIVLKNQSSALDAKVNEISNYYDANYTIVDSWITQGANKKTIGAQSWSSSSKYGESYNSNGYKVAYTQQTSNITLNPNEKAEVYIKFRLNNEAVRQLIEKQTTLNNISEISSFSTLSQGKAYAAIDEDSNPSSVQGITLAENKTTEVTMNNRKYNIETKTVDTTKFEDDTDVAPSLIMGIEDGKDRGLSGTVFEDENANAADDSIHMGEERVGDGILYTGGTYMGNGAYAKIDKNRVSGATVELLEYDENTTDHIARDENGNAKVAKIYQLKVENGRATGTEIDARTTTGTDGSYQFLGVVPGKYLIRYTYGEGSWIVDSEGKNIEEINVRDYKSTIITSNAMKQALNLEKKIDSSKDERMGDLNWILKYSDKSGQTKSKSADESGLIRYSDATDDVSKRDSTDDIYFESYLQNSTMTADTAFFDVGVEYSEVTEDGFNKKVTYTDYKDEYNLSGDKIVVLEIGQNGEQKIKLKDTFYSVNPYQDFGITERARQDYEVNKIISNLKLVLANGQVLISGNPYLQTVTSENDNSGSSKLLYTKALPGEVSIEIDNEILQGAQISIEYTISIKNKSEKDYQYTEDKDYYYYGTNGKNEVTGAIKKVVDYMESDLVYDDSANNDIGWQKVTAEDLLDWKENKESTEQGKQLIAKAGDQINGTSYNVYDGIRDGKYTISVTEAFNKNENKIKVGETSSIKLYGSKLLSTNTNGFNATNHTEIIEIVGVRSPENSIPGNYNPSNNGGMPDEPDDDKTKIVITPPTGLAGNRVFIISTITISLIILAGGVYFIKKKVLG